MGLTRRQFVTGGAVTAAAALFPTPAAAQFSGQPSDVTITGLNDARTEIETYQPLLDLSNLEVRPSKQYAWKATIEDSEFDYYSYWSFYAQQDGVSGDVDSHLPDREGAVVAVGDDGVDRAIYTTWHYAAETQQDPSLYDGTHPRLEVISPWHGHTPTTASGEFVELGDLEAEYSDWRANGWGVDEQAVLDPEFAESRGNWWPEEDQRNHRLAVLFHDATGGRYVPEWARLDT